MAETRPFAGLYPTRDEVVRVLGNTTIFGHDFSGYANTVVDPPLGDSGPGPLADKLTQCKSAALMTGWPIAFRVGVLSMLREASVELPTEGPKER